MVTTIKDTSFLYQVAIAEFFYRAKNLMSSLSKTVVVTSGHVFTIFAVVASQMLLEIWDERQIKKQPRQQEA